MKEEEVVEEVHNTKPNSATTILLKREATFSFNEHININNKTTSTSTPNNNNNNGALFGRSRYKLWVLAVIVLLALWSMFTGSITLKWSAGNLNPLVGDFDSPPHFDLDILEVEDREKVVRKMWDVYTHSRTIQLPKFWQMAFEAAFEELTSDLPSVRNAAVFEIAKMSLLSPLDNILQSPPAAPQRANVRSPIQGTLPSKLQKARRRL